MEIYDVMLYPYDEANAPPREERLLKCAAHYAEARVLTPGGFTLAREAGGKPYFAGRPDLHFSLSHSGGHWLAAFSGAPVGLDIQAHGLHDYLRIAKRWFAPEEYAAVKQHGDACFFDIWSAKESLCKQSGQGINAAFARFCVIKKGAIAPNCNGLRLQRLELWPACSAYLCAAKLGDIHIFPNL